MELMNMQKQYPLLFELISSLSSFEDFQNKKDISIDIIYEKVNDSEQNSGFRQLVKYPGSNIEKYFSNIMKGVFNQYKK